ncbi:MAG: malate dehydrogenase [DPANN group archaeon]|nr:malate dehydrogenase [DPANN group archaeon]
MTKITIVGAGNVGSQAAFYVALKNLGEIVLIDVVDGLAKGKALDILEAMPLAGSDIQITGGSDYALTKNSNIVVVTAGVARKPGMSRDDLTEINAKIIKSIIPEVVKYSPNCILIIVTNPLDAMVQLAYKLSGFPKQRVVGMAGVLDTTRFRTFLSQELKASVNDIEAMVLGGHGDLMVPLVSHCKVKGKQITQLLPKEKIDAIVQRVRDGGAEIVGLLKTGSAFFAPGLAIVEMIESILKDQKKILPCAALLEGEYGVNRVFVGVPVRLGKAGVEEVVELELTSEEKIAFKKSVEHVKELIKKI